MISYQEPFIESVDQHGIIGSVIEEVTDGIRTGKKGLIILTKSGMKYLITVYNNKLIIAKQIRYNDGTLANPVIQ